jgi:hypothetical protein
MDGHEYGIEESLSSVILERFGAAIRSVATRLWRVTSMIFKVSAPSSSELVTKPTRKVRRFEIA